nr:hypothetical protein [Methylobacterium brachythecii]
MRATLKARVIGAICLGPDDTVAVNEIACADPGCPDMETIVLVMRSGEPTQAFQIRKAIDAIQADDVSELVAQMGSVLRDPRS